MKKLLFFVFFLCHFNAYAETCPTKPSCTELGYVFTLDDCSGYKMLKCPFDQTQVFCYKTPKEEYRGKNCVLGDTFSTVYHRCTSKKEQAKDYIYIEYLSSKDAKMALTLQQKQSFLKYGSYLEAMKIKSFQPNRLINKVQLQKMLRYFLLHYPYRCALTQENIVFINEETGKIEDITSEKEFERCLDQKEASQGYFYDLRTAKLIYEPL